jgi:hypothetical protein
MPEPDAEPELTGEMIDRADDIAADRPPIV